MVIDPTKPLLRISVGREQQRHPGRQDKHPRPQGASRGEQRAKFGPKFEHLRAVLDRADGELILRGDPDSLAPERLMVFEVEGAVGNFITALEKIQGLTLIDEDELELEDAENSHLYLLVPSLAALKSIESLWRRWLEGKPLGDGFTPWQNVFKLLRDIRPWGPRDRLGDFTQFILSEEVEGKGDGDFITLEIEIVYRESIEVAERQQRDLTSQIHKHGGEVVHAAYIPDIHYHAILAKIPVSEIREMIALSPASLLGNDSVMYVCPQSLATGIELADEGGGVPNDYIPEAEPILALLDGFPVASHRDLAGRLIIDDQFGLEVEALVRDRVHGTAMASLITRGDLNLNEAPLIRKVHVVPVLGKNDQFPQDRLIVDLVYSAVTTMLSGPNPTAPHITIINLSLGNRRSLFDRRVSAWARLLDRLASEYGVLFVVSAGNHHQDTFSIPSFASWPDFEDAEPALRSIKTLEGIKARIGHRRLLSPSESVNSLTVGAANLDNVGEQERRGTRGLNPYPALSMPNPSSALGPGFANSVKPDVLFPGGTEHLSMLASGGGVTVSVLAPSRAHGLKVAAPPGGGIESPTKFSGNTSGATALAARTCHLIHDALEMAYGAEFLALSKKARSVLLKALLVHTASWPGDTAAFIKSVMGPLDNKQHVKQKDNLRRLMGYGFANPELAISCVSDRATFWSVGQLRPDKGVEVEIPIPPCIGALPRPHHIRATLAWFTPVAAGRKSYRTVRLTLQEPDGMRGLGVDPGKLQPDQNQGRRGTVYSRIWDGEKAPVVGQDHKQKFWVQREPDQGEVGNEPVCFGLAITLAMPGVNEVYQQVRDKLALPELVRT